VRQVVAYVNRSISSRSASSLMTSQSDLPQPTHITTLIMPRRLKAKGDFEYCASRTWGDSASTSQAAQCLVVIVYVREPAVVGGKRQASATGGSFFLQDRSGAACSSTYARVGFMPRQLNRAQLAAPYYPVGT
jgi:hypothetical protein